mmetsp:Transcript_68001/g.164431  ORF Transcript_68001/g.164431 Transcript_68001/m.164431 type:complete len:303 (+) Transcript_68001:80-988(+)
MLALGIILLLTTLLLCYAGYMFLVVDKKEHQQMLENPELYDELDDKDYHFDLPTEIDEYEDVRASKPTDKRTLPVALLKRAMADIPRIEQLEKDHPRMARLFNRGLLPFGVWEQLLEAEAVMDHEVHDVQAEAEKLQKGWGQGVFGQAYSMLRRERQEEKQHEQMRKDAAVLTIEFTKLSGGVVTFLADGRYLGDRTQMLLRKETPGAPKELAYKTDVKAELAIGVGEDQKTYLCEIPELELDKDSDKPQWKQLGHDSTQLRLQVKFVRKVDGLKTTFGIGDIRVTAPHTCTASPAAPPAAQ